MAKIPRIDQGNRPSSVTGVAPIPGAAYAAQGLKVLGGVARGALDVAVGAEVEKQKAEAAAIEAERKRLAEIMAAKQAIVDASDAGRIATKFENDTFNLISGLETEFATNPEAMPEEYLKRSREMAEQLQQPDKVIANDRVRLAAVKDAESTISSGLRAVYSNVSRMQTERVKRNLAGSDYEFTNTAAFASSPEAVAAMAEKFRGQQTVNYRAVYGKDAEVKLQETISRAYSAWGEEFSDSNPGQFLAGRENALLKKNISPEKYQALRKSAEASLDGVGKRIQNQIYVDAVRRGSQITALYEAGQLPVETIRATRESWVERKAALVADVSVGKMRKEDGDKAIASIDRELRVLDTVDQMRRSETKASLVPPDAIPAELDVMRKKIFKRDKRMAGKAKDLGDLLAYREAIYKFEAKEQINPATAAAMLKEVEMSMEKSAGKERRNTTSLWTPDDAKEIGNDELDSLFERDMPNATDAERNRATIQFIKMYNARAAAGKEPTEAEAPRLAQDAFRIARGLGPVNK